MTYAALIILGSLGRALDLIEQHLDPDLSLVLKERHVHLGIASLTKTKASICDHLH